MGLVMSDKLHNKDVIVVRASEIMLALGHAYTTSRTWQAELLELLILPQVQQRWRDVNWGELEIIRVPGMTWFERSAEKNRAETNWLRWAGYEFIYGGGRCWNRRAKDHYGHSAGVAWDGVRRETKHRFVETLLHLYQCDINQRPLTESLTTHHLRILEEHKVKYHWDCGDIPRILAMEEAQHAERAHQLAAVPMG